MQRYHQGQLDFFCAAYAVINALVALYGISLAQARALFATIISDVSTRPGLWHATLANHTDFHWLAAYMLFACGKGGSYPVRVFRPFMEEQAIPESAGDLANAVAYAAEQPAEAFRSPGNEDAMWNTLEEWLAEYPSAPQAGSVKKVAIFRFHRYVMRMDKPIVSHWTVMDHREGGIFHLRDASREEGALYSLNRRECVFFAERLCETMPVRIEPESFYFMERR